VWRLIELDLSFRISGGILTFITQNIIVFFYEILPMLSKFIYPARLSSVTIVSLMMNFSTVGFSANNSGVITRASPSVGVLNAKT